MILDIKAAAHFHVNADNTVTASCCIVNRETLEVFGFCKAENIPNDKPYTKPGEEYLIFPDDERHILYPVYTLLDAPEEVCQMSPYWRKAAEDDSNPTNKIVDAYFVSQWDGGLQIKTHCKVNMFTHEVFDIEQSQVEGVEVLDGEFVIINGKQYMVFEKDEYDELANEDVIKNAYWRN